MLYSVISTEHNLNVNAMAKQLATGNAAREQQLVRYAKACVQPAYQYFQSLITTSSLLSWPLKLLVTSHHQRSVS